jgi:hypothetical protein
LKGLDRHDTNFFTERVLNQMTTLISTVSNPTLMLTKRHSLHQQ